MAVEDMSVQCHDPAVPEDAAGTVDVVTEVRRKEALLQITWVAKARKVGECFL